MTTKADTDLMAHLLQLMEEGRQEGDGVRGHWTMSPEWYKELCRRFEVSVPWGPNAPLYMFGARVLLEVPGTFPKWHPYKELPVAPGQPLPIQLLGDRLSVVHKQSGATALEGWLVGCSVEPTAHGWTTTIKIEVPRGG